MSTLNKLFFYQLYLSIDIDIKQLKLKKNVFPQNVISLSLEDV